MSLREAVKLAEGNALGILESTDDFSFWGEDFFDEICANAATLNKAKKIVLNRIDRRMRRHAVLKK